MEIVVKNGQGFEDLHFSLEELGYSLRFLDQEALDKIEKALFRARLAKPISTEDTETPEEVEKDGRENT